MFISVIKHVCDRPPNSLNNITPRTNSTPSFVSIDRNVWCTPAHVNSFLCPHHVEAVRMNRTEIPSGLPVLVSCRATKGFQLLRDTFAGKNLITFSQLGQRLQNLSLILPAKVSRSSWNPGSLGEKNKEKYYDNGCYMERLNQLNQLNQSSSGGCVRSIGRMRKVQGPSLINWRLSWSRLRIHLVWWVSRRLVVRK